MRRNQKSVKVDEILYSELAKLRSRIGIPIAVSIRRAIIEYLKKHHSVIPTSGK